MAAGASPDPTPGAEDGKRATWSRGRKRLAVLLIVVGALGASAFAIRFAASTRSVNELLDRRALSGMARVALRGSQGPNQRPFPYADAGELERLTRPPERPLIVDRTPMRRFRMKDDTLIQEVITFPSAIRLDHAGSNTATAYVYRHGRLGERPVVVWVPGQYVVELAMIPISWFTREIVRRGADVVLFVPPYHLERTPRGFRSGDAVFDTSLSDHLNVFAQELGDLRRLVAWLRGEGVQAVGGFGGSAGAMLLLRMVTWEKSFDFLTLFIPMIHLAGVLDTPEAEPMRHRLELEGRSMDALKRVYAALDPTSSRPELSPARISVLYGQYDLVTPRSTTLAWARAWGVTRLREYDRGHALALFTPRMYPDYARLLDEDLRALGER